MKIDKAKVKGVGAKAVVGRKGAEGRGGAAKELGVGIR
jgi:hypothetical protein